MISVITPNYNYGNYLKQAIDSILTTNGSDAFEIVVVDDGSTDHSRAILEEYWKDKRVRVFFQKSNRGIAETVNFALTQARGKYLHFFASDDLHEPGSIDLIIEKIKEFPQVCLFTADYMSFDETGKTEMRQFLPVKEFASLGPEQVACLFHRTRFWLPGHTLFIKKEACKPYNAKLGPVCDWFNNHNLALKHGVGYFPQVLVKVRKHARAYSAGLSSSEKRVILRNLLEVLESDPDQYAPLFKSGICRMLGLKAVYLDLLANPRYWKYLVPMLSREFFLNFPNGQYDECANITREFSTQRRRGAEVHRGNRL